MALLERRDLGHLPEELQGLTEGLEGPSQDPRGSLKDVPNDLHQEVCGPFGHVLGVFGVDVAREQQGRPTVVAAAGSQVVGEVQELVQAVHPTSRAGEDGALFDLQPGSPFTTATPNPTAPPGGTSGTRPCPRPDGPQRVYSIYDGVEGINLHRPNSRTRTRRPRSPRSLPFRVSQTRSFTTGTNSLSARASAPLSTASRAPHPSPPLCRGRFGGSAPDRRPRNGR